jgi:hypothetical protein
VSQQQQHQAKSGKTRASSMPPASRSYRNNELGHGAYVDPKLKSTCAVATTDANINAGKQSTASEIKRETRLLDSKNYEYDSSQHVTSEHQEALHIEHHQSQSESSEIQTQTPIIQKLANLLKLHKPTNGEAANNVTLVSTGKGNKLPTKVQPQNTKSSKSANLLLSVPFVGRKEADSADSKKPEVSSCQLLWAMSEEMLSEVTMPESSSRSTKELAGNQHVDSERKIAENEVAEVSPNGKFTVANADVVSIVDYRQEGMLRKSFL